jgi:peptide/nickel transport system permease protein
VSGVTTYLGGRLLGVIPMLFLMSLVVFAIVYLIPGDPVDAMLGQDAERSAREALRSELGLDQPLWRQYVSWLGRVAHGDLGRSIRAQQPVRDLIVEKLPATLLLTTSAAVIALLIALPRRHRRGGEAQHAGRSPRHGRRSARRVDPELLVGNHADHRCR